MRRIFTIIRTCALSTLLAICTSTAATSHLTKFFSESAKVAAYGLLPRIAIAAAEKHARARNIRGATPIAVILHATIAPFLAWNYLTRPKIMAFLQERPRTRNANSLLTKLCAIHCATHVFEYSAYRRMTYNSSASHGSAVLAAFTWIILDLLAGCSTDEGRWQEVEEDSERARNDPNGTHQQLR